MTDKLKPCPFCGGKAEVYPMYGYVDVGCKCGAIIRGNYSNRKYGQEQHMKAAIEAWNNRVSEKQ